MRNLLFSDKFRYVKIFIPPLIIGLFVIYGEIQIPLHFPGYKEALDNPYKFSNKQIYFGGKIIEVNNDHYIVKNDTGNVVTNGEIDKANKGANISGKAVFHEDKSVTFTSYHISSLRGYKIWFSLFPALFIAYLFFKRYKFNFKKMMFE